MNPQEGPWMQNRFFASSSTSTPHYKSPAAAGSEEFCGRPGFPRPNTSFCQRSWQVYHTLLRPQKGLARGHSGRFFPQNLVPENGFLELFVLRLAQNSPNWAFWCAMFGPHLVSFSQASKRLSLYFQSFGAREESTPDL